MAAPSGLGSLLEPLLQYVDRLAGVARLVLQQRPVVVELRAHVPQMLVLQGLEEVAALVLVLVPAKAGCSSSL